MATLSIIPLQPVPSQSMTVSLSDQRCQITIYEKRRYPIGDVVAPAIYLDLYVNDQLLLGGVLLRNGVPVVRDTYFDFTGELVMFDTNGSDDPQTSGIGSRWLLGYVSP